LTRLRGCSDPNLIAVPRVHTSHLELAFVLSRSAVSADRQHIEKG